VHTEFWWRDLRRYHQEDLGLDSRIILEWIFKKWDGGRGWGMDWIALAQDRDRC
jgi:hypothetical protein